MDFIGDLGGVPAILLQIAGWVFGSYVGFRASMVTLRDLYRLRSSEKFFLDSKKNDPNAPDLHYIKMPLSTLVFLWMQSTMLGCFCKCCKNERHEKIEETLDVAGGEMENDFDIYNLI